MDKYEGLANEIIDLISEYIMNEYGIEPKDRYDDGGVKAENPALIYGRDYFDLECEIADKIRALTRQKAKPEVKQ